MEQLLNAELIAEELQVVMLRVLTSAELATVGGGMGSVLFDDD